MKTFGMEMKIFGLSWEIDSWATVLVSCLSF